MINLVILADEIGHKATDLGDRALNAKATPYVFCFISGAAGGFVLGVECVRAIFS